MNWINNHKKGVKQTKISFWDDECDRLLQNHEFEKVFGGDIPPNPAGKNYKKNKNCREEYQRMVELTKKEKGE